MGTMESRQPWFARAYRLALIGAGGIGIWLCGGPLGSGLAAEPSPPDAPNDARPLRPASSATDVVVGSKASHAPAPYLFFPGSERRSTPAAKGPTPASASTLKAEARTTPLGYLFFVPGKKPRSGTPEPTTRTTATGPASPPVPSKPTTGSETAAAGEHRLATRQPALLFFTPNKAKVADRHATQAGNERPAEAPPSTGSAARTPTPRASLEPNPLRQPEAPKRALHHDLGAPPQRPAHDRLTRDSLEAPRLSSTRTERPTPRTVRPARPSGQPNRKGRFGPRRPLTTPALVPAPAPEPGPSIRHAT